MGARSRPSPRQPDATAEKRLVEKDRLYRNYALDLRRRTVALREGPHGREICELMRWMKGMGLKSGPELVARVEAATWAREMGIGDRHLLLSIIGGAIRVLREREGLPPLDDPLWDQPPNVFERCKAILGVW